MNAYFDDYRRNVGSPRKLPQAMGQVYLAGAFHPQRCEVRVYNEQHDGPLSDLSTLEWADMLVLTGLTASLDRMRQLTAYARTLNPAIVVVAGGPTVRNLPRLCSQFFDYPCAGDVEQLVDVIGEVFGADFAAREIMPRYDLARSVGRVGYAESSRYCNFRCSFCALTAEGRAYVPYEPGYLKKQILALGKRSTVMLIDNNFFGNDRQSFRDRLAVLKDLHDAGHLKRWGALVTADFFADPENLRMARSAGCHILFSGVESFDLDTLGKYKKKQNLVLPQVEMIRSCLEAGILFTYGLMLDPMTRDLRSLGSELDFILGEDSIPLPSFLTLAIPLLGTPHFHECLTERRILPGTLLRNMDGLTVVTRCVDPVEAVAGFLETAMTKRGRRLSVLRHTLAFLMRYRSRLDPATLAVAAGNAGVFSMPSSSTSRISLRRRPRKTYLGATESLDPQYRPLVRVDARYRSYFDPIPVTDESGELAGVLEADLGSARVHSVPRKRASGQA